LSVSPVPLSTRPVPLHKPRARHEPNPFDGSHERRLPTAARREVLHFSFVSLSDSAVADANVGSNARTMARRADRSGRQTAGSNAGRTNAGDSIRSATQTA